ncbi:MAG: MMPL family transporter [Myxococcota bacterium]|nr:MMPL family transporter [Myxococcota bacterium]
MANNNVVDRAILAFTSGLERLPEKLIGLRWVILAFFAAFTATTSYGIQSLTIDQSLDIWFDEDDDTLGVYRVFRRVFGGDENIVVLYRAGDGDVFSSESLQQVRALENKLNRLRTEPDSQLDRIVEVQSLLSVDVLESDGDTLLSRPLIGKTLPQTKDEVEAIRKRAQSVRDLEGSFFSADFKYGLLIIRTDFNARLIESDANEDQADEGLEAGGDDFDFDFDEETTAEVVAFMDRGNDQVESTEMDPYMFFMEALRKALDQEGWYTVQSPEGTDQKVETLLAGAPVGNAYFISKMLPEMNVIGGLSMIVIICALYFAFGSLSYVVWPLVILTLSLIWTFGTVALLGIHVTMLINVVAMLNMAVGVASSIHILNAYQLGLTEGLAWKKALGFAYGRAGFPVMLALTTTMAGLLSLTSVPLAPMRAFGMYASLGVFLAMIGTILLLPVLMSFWFDREAPKARGKLRSSVDVRLKGALRGTHRFSRERPVATTLIFLSVLGLAGLGFPKVMIDTNYNYVIKEGEGISEAVAKIDELFGGTANLEVVLDTGELDGVKSPDVLKALEAFENQVLAEAPTFVNRAFSLVKMTKESYQRLTDDQPENYRIPDDRAAIAQTLTLYESADPENRKLFVDDNWQIARVTFSGYSRGSSEYEDFIDNLDQWLVDHFAPLQKEHPNLTWHRTGSVSMIMHFADIFTRAQITSFGLALIVISLIVLVAFGSIKFGLLAMIPNIFPIFMLVGAAGWLGFPFDADTLIVIPVAIGIAVDDTIHFLTHYRTEILRGLSPEKAIATTIEEVGQAMTYTTVVLVLSYLCFIFMVYKPLTAFGVLSSVAIGSALIADLFIVPVLLRYFKPFAEEEVTACLSQPSS